MTLWTGSACSGYGGLDLAVRAVLGGKLAWVADTDPGASAILSARFPGVPNLGDISAADWESVPGVDVLTAGFPCQDVSCAGARKGLRGGTRTGVWSHVAEAIGVLRPPLVLLENVRGLLSAGADSVMESCPWCLGEAGDEHALRAAGAVLGDLADLGFDAEWQVISAADAGAPHRRERVFILAWPAEDANSAASGEWRIAAPGQAESWRPRADAGRSGGARTAAHADGSGRGPGERHVLAGEPDAGGCALADAERGGRDGWPPDAERGPWERIAPAGSGEGDLGRATPADPGGARLGQHAGGASPQEAGALAGDKPSGDRGVRPDSLGRPATAYADSDGLPRGEERDGNPAYGQPERADRRVDPLGRVLDWGPYGPAVGRWERVTGRPAPRPTEPGRTSERLSPAFVEWMQGLSQGWVTDVPGLSRNAMLKALGNGVVPQQAELALRLLLDRSGLLGTERAA